MRDADVRQQRKTTLVEPHMARLTAYVAELRRGGTVEVPDFDPLDGGVEARVLFLFEKPRPMTVQSGFMNRLIFRESGPSCGTWFHGGTERGESLPPNLGTGVALFASYHPCPLVRARFPAKWEEIPCQWAKAMKILQGNDCEIRRSEVAAGR